MYFQRGQRCSQCVIAYSLVLKTIGSGEFQDGDFLKKVMPSHGSFIDLHQGKISVLLKTLQKRNLQQQIEQLCVDHDQGDIKSQGWF